MNGIFLSVEEIELLSECSPEATRVYVLALRPRMDAKTAIVGRASRLSINGIAQAARFDPPNGSKRKPFCPTHRQTECLLDELIRNGLCERVSTPAEKKNLLLVLKLSRVLAAKDNSFCQKQERAMSVEGTGNERDGENIIVNQCLDTGFADQKNCVAKPEERAISKISKIKNDEMRLLGAEQIFVAAPQVEPITPPRPDSLADFDCELRSAGYSRSQVLQAIAQLKALKAQGATVEHLRDGIRIAKDKGGVSVAYAAKCAASICRQQKQALATPTASAPKCQKTRRLNDIPSHHAHSPAVPALRSMQDMPVVSSINDWSL